MKVVILAGGFSIDPKNKFFSYIGVSRHHNDKCSSLVNCSKNTNNPKLSNTKTSTFCSSRLSL